MIRNATEADVPAILAIYAPYVLTSTATFEYDVPTTAEFLQRFRDITTQFPWLVWEEDGRILGYVYASRPYARAAYSWCAEPSVYLLPEARGRGIGAKLYAVLETCLKFQGYQLLYALVTLENTASVSFHKKLGYFIRGSFPDCAWKFGRSLGVSWMEKRLSLVEPVSSFPTPWPVIMQDKQKFSDILDTLSLS
jgi:phosphinothricin acetyltransferase